MVFLALKEKLKDFIVFNLNDIRKIDVGFDLRRLSESAGKRLHKNDPARALCFRRP